MSLERLAWPTYVKGGFRALGEKLATLSLPSNKIFSYVPREADTTEADLIARNFEYFFDVAAGSTDNAHRVVLFTAPLIREYAYKYLYDPVNQRGKYARDWTQADVEAFIGGFYPYGIMTDSLDEGYDLYEFYTFNTGTIQRDWANDALARKAKTVTPNSVLIASYAAKYLEAQDVFFQAGTNNPINPSNQANRNALASQANARAGITFYSKSVSAIARPNVTIYPGTGLRNVNGNWSNYIVPFAFQRLTLASGSDLAALGFSWYSLEGQGYTGDYAWRHDMANGTLWQNDEIFWSHNKAYHSTMSSFIFGGGQILWDRPDRFLNDPSKVVYNNKIIPGEVNVADVWTSPNGSPPPASSLPRYFPMRPQSIADASIASADEFGRMAQAAGTAYQFRRYRINRGGSWSQWYEVASDIPAATILDAAADFRGICVAAVTGNDVWVYFQDPSCPILGERAQVDLGGGRFVDFNVFGQEPVRIRGSINANATQTLNR